MTRAIADKSRTIRLPVHIYEMMNKIKKVRRVLDQELEREPTTEELAEATGEPIEKIERTMNAMRVTFSLDALINNEDGDNFSSLMDNGAISLLDSLAISTMNDSLLKGFKVLDEREKVIVTWRFNLDNKGLRTLEEVGNRFKITKERARQIERGALEKLSKVDGLRDLL